jgi:hypothetical protein
LYYSAIPFGLCIFIIIIVIIKKHKVWPYVLYLIEINSNITIVIR